MDEINVHVVDYGRRSLYMRYRDPVTGKHVTRSTGTKRKRDADRTAAKWEADVREGRSRTRNKATWEIFRDRVEADYLPPLAKKSIDRIDGVLDSFERIIQPNLMAAITTDVVTQWQRQIRKNGLAEATIKSNSAILKAALRWAASIGLIREAPAVIMPKRAKGSDRQTPMKGRAITDAEFYRMVDSVDQVFGVNAADSWKLILRGLWLSGLRLSEALSLTWDNEDELRVDATGRHVMLAIPAERQKNHRDELLPIAPEFRDFLLETPVDERVGFVFPLVWQRQTKRHDGRRVDTVSKTITAFGQAADVVVSVKNGKTKYASAHDLRRTFGDRWAARVPSLTLKTLMRHKSIETTERYYVTRNAETVMDELEAFAADS